MKANSQQRATTAKGGRSSFASAEARSRVARAEKILAILADHCRPEHCDALDIGTGSGIIAQRLGGAFRSLVSVDVSDQRVEKKGYTFVQVPDERLPFSDERFDVVISNQVIEHVWNPSLHVSEMARVMKSTGVAYLATPNRFAIVEPHYRLPFLSWLPEKAAGAYLRLSKGKRWDVRPFSYRGLLALLTPRFRCEDMAPRVCSDPVRYGLMGVGWKASLVERLPRIFWKARANPLLPSFMLTLWKSDEIADRRAEELRR